jgi:hypothetical protein
MYPASTRKSPQPGQFVNLFFLASWTQDLLRAILGADPRLDILSDEVPSSLASPVPTGTNTYAV